MSFNWFVRKGIIFRPVSPFGWTILFLASAYAVYMFIDIDSRSHSASDTLVNWVFNCLIVAVVYSVIGFLTEKRR